MRKASASLAVLVGMLIATAVSAQSEPPRRQHRPTPKGSGNHANDTTPFNLQRAQLGTEGFARTARERMKQGDFDGAIDLFDQAIAESVDPTLYRDRGSCHDKLGHPYPAIEDYRVYVTNAADAKDADSFRDRLDQLQAQVRGLPPPATAAAREDAPPKDDPVDRPDEPVATTPAAASADATPASPDESEDDRPPSSLREGRGWVLAPLLGARKWFRDGRSFGDRETWDESVGGQIRYSFASRSTLILEAAYQRFNSTDLDAEVISGLSSEIAYELRMPLNARDDDQLLFGLGVGYEHLVFQAGADEADSSYSEGGIAGRLRFGYRHMLARSVALDVSLDGGGGGIIKYDPSVDSHSTTFGLAGLTVALAWGL